MAWTTPVSPSTGQLVGDGTGGSYNWGLQVRDNLLALLRVLDRDVTEQEVTNTAAETTVYTYAIAGNTLPLNGKLRLRVNGDFLNNTGGNSSPSFRVTFGGVTIALYTPTLGADANRRNVLIEAEIVAANATNAQRAMVHAAISAAAADSGTALVADQVMVRSVALTRDMTASQTLAVTVQHDGASTTRSFFMRNAFLELMP